MSPGLKIIFKTSSDDISDGLSFGSDIIRWWKESSSKILLHPIPRQIAGDLSVMWLTFYCFPKNSLTHVIKRRFWKFIWLKLKCKWFSCISKVPIEKNYFDNYDRYYFCKQTTCKKWMLIGKINCTKTRKPSWSYQMQIFVHVEKLTQIRSRFLKSRSGVSFLCVRGPFSFATPLLASSHLNEIAQMGF